MKNGIYLMTITFLLVTKISLASPIAKKYEQEGAFDKCYLSGIWTVQSTFYTGGVAAITIQDDKLEINGRVFTKLGDSSSIRNFDGVWNSAIKSWEGTITEGHGWAGEGIEFEITIEQFPDMGVAKYKTTLTFFPSDTVYLSKVRALPCKGN